MALSAPITIDGVTYPRIHVMSIKRNFQVLDGENAGRSLEIARMIRDIKGTFYNYSMEFDANDSDPSEYDALYDTLSAPMDSHIIIVPYAQRTLTYEAYVTQGSDELELMFEDRNRWGRMSINFIAMEPQRTP